MGQSNNKSPVIVYFGGFALPNKNAAAHRAVGNAQVFNLLNHDTRIVGFQNLSGCRVQYVSGPEPHIGMVTMASQLGRLPIFSSFRINPMSAIAYLKHLSKRRTVSHVICYNYPSIAQAGIQVYCKLKGIRYLSDVTEWNTDSGLGLLYNTLRSADITLRIRALNRLASALITTSPYITSYYGGPKQGIAEIPTLFDKDTFVTLSNDPANPSDPIKLMFVGPAFDLAIERPQQNDLKERIDLVVKLVDAVLEQGGDITLNVFGIDKDVFLRAFPDDAARVRKHDAHLRFHGRVSHERILRGLHDSDFSVLLRDNKHSNNAGFPTKFAESLLAGTPVVMDEIESIKAYHDHPHTLMLQRNSPENMARQLLDKVVQYRERENNNPSPKSSYQTFHYANFKDEMSKVIGA